MLYQTLAARAKDTLALAALVALFMSVLTFLFQDRLKPFVELPRTVGELSEVTSLIRLDLDKFFTPQLIRFQGLGLVVDDANAIPGGYIEILHFVRREASCETRVNIQFYNVDTGRVVAGPIIPAQKAPVTKNFIPFPLRINLPKEMKSGERYVYYPTIEPLECGVYDGEFRANPTGIFTVK